MGNFQMVETYYKDPITKKVDPWKRIAIVNLIGQNNYGAQPIKYVDYFQLNEAIARFFNQLDLYKPIGPVIQAPKFGAGLAGGNWNIIEKNLVSLCNARHKSVTIITP
jgi:hypothetical protein